MAYPHGKLPLAPLRHQEAKDVFEVGVTNIFGSFRLMDFMTFSESDLLPGETFEELAQKYIEHMQASSDDFFEKRRNPVVVKLIVCKR